MGRFPDGTGPLVPLNSPTFGQANTARWLGDVVISEVHYAPADPDGPRGLNAEDFGFIEIYNRSNQPVDLGDWQLVGSVQMVFAPGLTIEPGDVQLVVSFDPTDVRKASMFRFTHNLASDFPLLGRYRDVLGTEQGEVSLVRTWSDRNAVIVADRVSYQNGDPWPTISSAAGQSLTRHDVTRFGDDPSNWRAAAVSAGSVDLVLPLLGDANGDGRFDQLDIVRVLQAAKYGTGQAAAFDEGDWTYDGFFDALDIVMALRTGRYMR